MLSTKTVGNIRDAKHYFLGKDNYYMNENDNRSLWFGKGADSLGLSGEVKAAAFEDLLKGKLPSGEQLGKIENGKVMHRPGFDLTFSVPKSVSMMAMMAEDKEVQASVIQSIFKSVEKTLSYVERSTAQARITKEGETYYIKTGNLVAALFLHDLSRENEPDLHVHCVVMNMTKRPDAKWRSLASKSGFYGESATHEINGFFEQVRHHKKFFGALFRSELAYNLKQKEFPIIVTNPKEGYFEIDGISEKAREAFSTRREKILTFMEEKGLQGGKGAALATVMTRPPKKAKSLETLKEEWNEKGKTNRIDPFQEVNEVIKKNKEMKGNESNNHQILNDEKETKKAKESREVLQLAIDYLTEDKVEIKQMALMNYALKYSVNKEVNVESIQRTIDDFKKSGGLITLKQNDREEVYTTKALLSLEQEILRFLPIKQSHNSFDQKKIQTYLAGEPLLTKEQIRAMTSAFLTEERISAIVGKSHTGKTFMIKAMVDIAKLNGFRSVVLTPNKLSSKSLQEDIQKAPNLVQGFFKKLFDHNEYASVSSFINKEMELNNVISNSSKRVIFVDNGELLHLKQMKALFDIADKTNARLIMLGDPQSIETASAGSPFKQIIEHGVSKVILDKPFPNIQNVTIQEALNETLTHNIDMAFKKIGDKIVSIENKEDRDHQIAIAYAKLDESKRQQTLVLMPSKTLCSDGNLKIREALKDENQIEQKGLEYRLLIPKKMKEVSYQFALSYSVGQFVRFNEMYPSLKINKSDYLQVVDINKVKNIVTLKNGKGERIQWDPRKVGGQSKKVEVFDEKIKEISVGESLIATRNNPLLNIASSERLKVLSIKGQTLVLELENRTNKKNQKIKLNLNYPCNRHLDYGYVLTPYQAYNRKEETVIAYQSSYSKQSHQRLFYKIVSQAKSEAIIYTENKDALLKHLKDSSGNKVTTIDTLLNTAKVHLTKDLQSVEKAIFQILQNLEDKYLKIDKSPEIKAKEAIKYALAHLTEREAAFQHKEVLVEAIKHALGDVDVNLIQEAVLLAEKQGDLVRGSDNKNGTRWTTKEAIALEDEILNLAKKDQGKLSPIVADDKVEAYLSNTTFKNDHTIAIREWMGAKERVIVMQGNAGTGKTTLLQRTLPLLQANSLLADEGYQLLCLAPTHVAVKELTSRGLRAQTLDSFLVEQNKLIAGNTFQNFQNKLIIALDENSMASNKRELDFLKIIHAIEARAIVIGDTRQYASIEAGKPHSLLQAAGVKTIFLTDIVRQKEHTLIKAVDETYRKEFAQAFSTINDSIVEIGQVKTSEGSQDVESLRLTKMAEDYLALSKEKRSQMVVITSSNKQRVHLNSLIREGLIKSGELVGESVTSQVLVSKDLTQIEKTNILHFKVGDIVRFGFKEVDLGINKDDYLTVAEVHKKAHVLELKNGDGESFLWNPRSVGKHAQNVEVYRLENRELMQGDLIRWMRSDKKEGLLSPELAIVKEVFQNKIQLQHINLSNEGFQPGSHVFEINPTHFKFKHWDHAYVMTSYGVQGKSIQHVMANMESHNRHLTTQAAFLINLTRSIESFTLYTDNKTKLLDKILMSSGTKTSALETIGKLDFKSNENLNKSIESNKLSKIKSQDSNLKKANQKIHRIKKQVDINKINSKLQEHSERFLIHLLGEPKSRSATHFQYSYSEQFGGEDGNKAGGSLSIAIQGEKQGLWHSFKTGEGGNLLSLIQKKLGVNFKESLAYAMRFLGQTKDNFLLQEPTKITENTSKKDISVDKSDPNYWTDKQKKQVRFANKLVLESLPLKDTLAEKYLREHRGITFESVQENIRFHPGIKSRINGTCHPALLAIAKNSQGDIQAVQAIYLDEKTSDKANVKVKKQTFGVLPGASVDLISTNKNSQITFLAEGVETAISVLQATKNRHVKVTLGKENFKHPSKRNLGKHVVLCLDNDKDSHEIAIHQAAKSLLDDNKILWIAKPEGHVKDYNDVLKSQGEKAIYANIQKAITYEDYANKIVKPTRTLKDEMKETPTFIHNRHLGKVDPDTLILLQNSGLHFKKPLSNIDLKDLLISKITDKCIENVAAKYPNKNSVLTNEMTAAVLKETRINQEKLNESIQDKTQEL